MDNKDKNTILWWIGWIVLTIVSFFVSCWFWTGFIAKNVGPMSQSGVPILWVTAVFGSWMVLLVPLIVVMYNKVDRAYEDARISRETRQFEAVRKEVNVRSVQVEEKDRLLPRELADKVKKMPEALRKGHLVSAVLKDGRRFDHVFIANRREVLGIYDQTQMPFRVSDIADLVPADLDKLPNFEENRWLRLDGVC
jgi:uncharacterized membrane protein